MENAYDVIMTSISVQYFRKPQCTFFIEATITTPNLVWFGSKETKVWRGEAESAPTQIEIVLNRIR